MVKQKTAERSCVIVLNTPLKINNKKSSRERNLPQSTSHRSANSNTAVK